MSLTQHSFGPLGLESLRLKSSTRLKYSAAVRAFLTFHHMSEARLLALRTRRIDRMLVEFIEDQYRRGAGITLSIHALSGLSFLDPHLRNRLVHSGAALGGYRTTRPVTSWMPLTIELVTVISLSMSLIGRRSESVAILVAFDGYLRISEYLQLRRKDIALQRDDRLGSAFTGMAIRLANTKTGPDQWVTIEIPYVVQIFQTYLTEHRFEPEERVFPFTANALRTLLRDIASRLDLPHLHRLSPHSLRHGGATSAFLHGRDLNYIQHRGRWQSTKSVWRYIQAGACMLLTEECPGEIINAGRELTPYLESCMKYIWSIVPESAPNLPRRVTFDA